MSGTLHIVGLGPGGPEHRTAAAARAVREAEVVVGYGPYVDQCADLLEGQEIVRGAMGEEGLRADEALDRAAAGARVALVSSGDAGVYGMASRTLARAAALAGRAGASGPANAAAAEPAGDASASDAAFTAPQIVVVPGMTVAQAAAAALGAPLADDFATLSLSDLHVPWATVEARLAACAGAGLALALYNPRSRARTWQLDRVLELLRAARPADTAVGVATDVGRAGEHVARTTLGALDPAVVGMRTLLVVAGERGGLAGEWMVAERTLDEPRPTPTAAPFGSEPAERARLRTLPSAARTSAGSAP